MKRPIAIDLFAGAGGLSLGFEQAGFDIAVAVEHDPIHAATHEYNFPYTSVLCRDVREVTGADLRASLGVGSTDVDVIVGGPPCQGFSLIGNRVLEDPRNELVFHFLRLVSEVKPKTFVMENVPGIARGAHRSLLIELVERFEREGYRVRLPHQILNAGNFGVPQDRQRVFIIGARSDTHLPEYPKFSTLLRGKREAKASHTIGLFDSELPKCPSVSDALGDLPEIEDYESLLVSDMIQVRLSSLSDYARLLHGDTPDPANLSYRREYDPTWLTGCARAQHTELTRSRFALTEPGMTEPISRFFRLPPDGMCNTLRAGTGSDHGAFSAPRPIHPYAARCISVREAARLHSYPDWFRFHRTIWHGFRQIGNSVPPLLARAVGTAVLQALGRTVEAPTETLRAGESELVSMIMREAASHFGVRSDVIPTRRRLQLVG